MPISIKKQESSKKSDAQPSKQRELTVVSRVIKGDTYMVMADAAKELEDEFVNLYQSATAGSSGVALLPPFPPKTLRAMSKQNNILNQCIQAMEVNIDGSGHEFVPSDPQTEIDPKELEIATSFFNEPYPNKNWIALRRALRVDLESIGYGYFEVLRTLDKTIAGVRHLEATTIRMVRLGEAIPTVSSVMRGGQEIEFTSLERHRRFLQVINGNQRQYFKEFGCQLSLNRKTGEWAAEGKKWGPQEEATELLFFGLDRDVSSPYFVPRWINQLPSVIGSRKAEEYNLEFFDSGGMPPAIIFLQGGSAVGDSANQLRTYLSSQNKRKGRAVVVELQSNNNSLDSGGSVSARVERFGAEKAGDHMFGKYDAAAEEHVRIGFRLPPIFVGKAQDYNYATAVVAYQVAEAQVFQPEREEFDEVINKTIIKGLGLKTLKFKSNPITLKSLEEKFKAIELIKDLVPGEDLVKELNTSVGTEFKYKEAEPGPTPVASTPVGLKPLAQPNPGANGAMPVPTDESQEPDDTSPAPKPVAKSTLELLGLVRRYAQITNLADTGWQGSEEEVRKVEESVGQLAGEDQTRFAAMLAEYARTRE